VKCPEPGTVEVHTKHFRFDYERDGDTLREFDKMGPLGVLIRLRPDQRETVGLLGQALPDN
jgi:hypothetical protein